MRFGILGPLRVSAGSHEVVFARRERVLLAVLLLHANRSVSVERVVDAIWGERPPADSTGQVHSSVYRLRKRLAAVGGSRDVIVTDPAGYRVRVDPESLDLAQFRGLRDQARAAAGSGNLDHAREGYRAALDLWRGRALDGTDSDVIRHAAAGLDEEHVQAAEECIEVELALGRSREVVAELTELVGQHPHREGLHRALMVALYRAGRQADALAAYRSARASLREELGLEPGPELQRLHQAILNRDPELDLPPEPPGEAPADPGRSTVPRPRELPADVAGFTGRGDALKALDGLLAGPVDGSPVPVVISAIVGTAGVGKTALAVHWGHRVAAQFPDAQLYINLRGHATGPPLSTIEALAALLYSLGTPPEQIPTEEAQATVLYRSQLADRRMLIVLDNAGSAEQVRPLLPGAGGCLVLVTSRDRLTGLVAHDGARRITLDVLSPDEAHTLLAHLLGADRVRGEPEAAGELAQACAHLPLALRVAAANLVDHPRRTIATHVAELTAEDRLSSLQVEGDRDSAVRATFDLSYQRLPAEGQRLFRLLGLVPGSSFTAAAAAALTDTHPAETGRLLERLAGAHLIEEPTSGRYAFHDLLRLYAFRLTNTEDRDGQGSEALHRLLNWYLHAADAAAGRLYPEMLRLPARVPGASMATVSFGDGAEASAWLNAERSNLVAAIQRAADYGPRPLAWLLVDCLRGYFWRTRHTVDWLMAVSAAMTAADQESDPEGRASAQLSMADLHQNLGRHSESISFYRLALESAKRAGWADGEAAALSNTGMVHWSRGELAQAADCYTQGLQRNRQAGRLGAQATNGDNLGVVSRELGRLQDAAYHHTRAVELHRMLGSVAGEATALNNLGEADQERGLLPQARTHLTRALSLFRMIGSPPGQASALQGLAMVCIDAGQFSEALGHARAAVVLSEKIDNIRYESAARKILSHVWLCLHDSQQALADMYRALALARQVGTSHVLAHALIGLANVQHRLGKHVPASKLAHEALELARNVGYRLIEGQALTVLAEIRQGQGRHDEAVDFAYRALDNHRETGHRIGEAGTLVVLGDVRRKLEGPEAGLEQWRAARELFSSIGAFVPEDLVARLSSAESEVHTDVARGPVE